MQTAGLVNKVGADDPAASPAAVLLRMATTEAAAALGIAHLVGSLETGKRADVIAVDRRGPQPLPFPGPGRKNAVARRRPERQAELGRGGQPLLHRRPGGPCSEATTHHGRQAGG